jgi:hypothetical protein
MEVPGLTPTLLLSVLGPVLVTDCPPRTEYELATPRPTFVPIAIAGGAMANRARAPLAARARKRRVGGGVLTVRPFVEGPAGRPRG